MSNPTTEKQKRIEEGEAVLKKVKDSFRTWWVTNEVGEALIIVGTVMVILTFIGLLIHIRVILK